MGAAEPAGHELRPLAVGEVIGRAGGLYRSNAGPIWRIVVPLMAVTELLYAILNLSAVPSGSEVINGRLLVPFGSNVGAYNGAVAFEGLFIPLVVVPLLSAMVLRVLSEAYLGRRADPQAALRFGLRHLLGMIWIGLLYGLAVLAGLIALVIPGIYLYIALSLAFAAYIVEGRSGAAALRRSRELVRGRWWPTFGALAIYGVIGGLVNYALPSLLESLEQGTTIGVTTYIVLLRLVSGVCWVLVAPFGAAVAMVIYFDLRVRKEGFDAAALGDQVGAGAGEEGGPPPADNPFALGSG
jgi:hypothetical protein